MNIVLDGKRALVCGSTQGIGRASAIELAAAGAEVTLLARSPDRLAAVVGELPVDHGQHHDSIAADFNDPEAVRKAVQAALDPDRPYHILVNNTGGPRGGPAMDADPAVFELAFRAHVVCNQILATLLVPGMKGAGYGRIINIISTSVKQPIAGLGVSNTIRGAVASWAKTLAGELGPFAITVNNVLPGFTDTSRLEELFKARAERTGRTLDEVRAEAIAGIPAGRLAEPAELGAAVAFLASPAAGYINGINLPVDGGRLSTL
ncbi:MAG: SDR family oxidoreductase [Planctomycetes bacterium]|nr:SDR family oxidoreductase [Planctomycetota bacterium]